MQLLALIGAAFLVYWVVTHLGLVFGLIFAFAKFIVFALGALIILGIVMQMISGKKNAGNTDQKTAKDPIAESPANRRWFEVLGVNEFASPDEIKRAYRDLIRQYHPDKVGAMGEKIRELAMRETQIINAAFQEARLNRRF
ncbi:J domain-containing protein [Gluconobacter sphaericus]|uniref:J domain-containing protein n=1 Tax=Gluconobacter sphaericus TaxID=574987 RepID=UPI001B8CD9EA|nr:J domain-containing protein [Gluconobacter sphaericus]MBS1098597.1 J domain-containing protein [Gluconobacter sphaericus]